MENNKNVIIAVVLSVMVLLGWQYVSRWIWPPAPAPATAVVSGTGAPVGAAVGVGGGGSASATAAGGTAAAPGAVAPAGAAMPAERAPEVVRFLESPDYRVAITSRGGALLSWELKNPRWAVAAEGAPAGAPRHPLDLVTVRAESERSLRLAFDSAPFPYPAGADDYVITSPAAASDALTMRWTDPAGRGWVEKRFKVDPASFHLRVEVTVHNATAAAADVKPGVVVTGWQDPTKASTRSFLNPVVDASSAVCMVNDGIERAHLGDALKGMSTPGVVRWAGIDRQYFLLSVLPDPNPAAGNCEWGAVATGLITTSVKFAKLTAPPGGDASWSMWLYGGPKVSERLSLKGVEMERAIDYGWLGFLCRPMIGLMKIFHGWFGNWGLSIILLTLCVRAATFYWNQKAYKSMQDMARLKPEMDRLKAKLGDDKEKLNVEIAALMRNHNVNPLGGCLPMLLPMPIFFALYYTIFYSAEMFRAPFFGWIHDLSSRDPFYVFPVLTGITMVISGLLTPVTTDNMQARMIRYVMPVVFTGMMLFLPSALSVYYFVNTMLGIVQQWVVRRKYGTIQPTAGPEALKKPADLKGAKDLVQALERGSEDMVQKAAVWLGALAGDPAAKAAAATQGTMSPLVTYAAALRPLLERNDAEVRARAARVLGAARDVQSVPRLVAMLKGEPGERRAAIEALGKIGDDVAREPLQKSMKLSRIWEYPSIMAALTNIEQSRRANAGKAS
ncbi:MAG TPA: membrane protein insertase YidC [Myxococcota bacterium]|nr:membrane protein insertase YidC [Myxococcota bacterium]